MMTSSPKRVYPLQNNEISIIISLFDANKEHYSDYRYPVNIISTFKTISQHFQEKVLNKSGQPFEFMEMEFKDYLIKEDDTPIDISIKDSDIIMATCRYFAQRDTFDEYFRS